MNNSVQKVNSQFRLSSPLLLLFSAPFIVWQMGVLYFSGTTMSLFGRTPIPIDADGTAIVIGAGYLVSIVLMCVLPRKMVLIQRVLMPAALIATAGMLLPLSEAMTTALFYISVFVCVFSIGAMMSIAAQHFTVETTWRDGIISMIVGGALIAVLQNDLFEISFTVFTIFSIALIAAQTAFYYLIPTKITAPYAGRDSTAKMSRALFFGIWLVIGFATLLVCFASSFAESVSGGVSVLYSSAAVMATALYILRKKLKNNSIRVFGVFFGLSVLGFVLAFLSLYLPILRLVACVLMGFVLVLANLWIFFGAASFSVYPTRFVGAIGAALGFVLAAFHSQLQNALRDNPSLLYGIYAALSVALLLVYFFMEPHFTRLWSRKPEAVPRENKALGPHPFDALSEQERILAGLILEGHSETSAASLMNISLNTQKSYRKNLYAKLDIHTKRELFEIAKND